MDAFEGHMPLPKSSVQGGNTHREEMSAPVNSQSPHELVPSTQTHIEGDNGRAWDDNAVEDSGPAAIPASVVSEVTKHSPVARAPEREHANPDIISRGILTVEQAELMFNYYMTKHDNYVYSVLEEGSTFTTTRNSSPLLLAAICAVASLHVLSPEIPYESCYEELVQLSASRMFSSKNSLDDIRGLCIGAFWLPDMSWILITTGRSTIRLNL